MQILVAGVNHKTAPLGVREKLAFDTGSTVQALKLLKSRYTASEFVLLSTCNRVEIYCASEIENGPAAEDLTCFIAEFQNVKSSDFQDCLYVYHDRDAVEHLLIVASSLDSLVVGEPQIVGQVKDSYRIACEAGSTGKILNRLFHCAFGTSKKVHNATSISTGRVSVAGFAVELAKQLFEDISSARVVVIGAGQMGETLVQNLLQEGCRKVTILNRSYQRALDKAGQYGVNARRWDRLNEELLDADIVIGSASTRSHLFTKDSFHKISQRHRGSLLIIDIAVPRNFEPSINDFDNVYLYTVDDLSRIAEENRKVRENCMSEGEKIVNGKAADFMNWFKARDIGPLIGQMKQKFDRITRKELQQFFVGDREKADYKEQLEIMVNKLVNKLLHCVIENVDTVAKKQGPTEAARMVQRIVAKAEEISEESENYRKKKS